MKRTPVRGFLMLILLSTFPSVRLYAQQPGVNMDAQTRRKLVEGVISSVHSHYIFADVAQRVEQAVRLRVKSGSYDMITDPETFAKTLTSDLRQDSHDKHFFVQYSKLPLIAPTEEDEKKQQQEDNYHNSLENFGFEKVSRFSGNVGYLDYRGFADPKASAETLAAAMTFLTNTNALIIDLRGNRGGDPAMVELFCSYFFEKKTKIGDFYYRDTGVTEESWTLEAVAGKRYVGKDVYVLTNKASFSAAEAFAYMLQSRKAATVVGETTGGAANPETEVRLDDHFSLFVPHGKVTDTVTETNWEGVGVNPNVEVSSARAFTKAYLMALKKNLKNRNHSDLSDSELHEKLATLENELHRAGGQ